MESRNITTVEVAYLLNVSEATVYRWLTNDTAPHPGNLRSLANLLNVEVKDLYDSQEAA